MVLEASPPQANGVRSVSRFLLNLGDFLACQCRIQEVFHRTTQADKLMHSQSVASVAHVDLHRRYLLSALQETPVILPKTCALLILWLKTLSIVLSLTDAHSSPYSAVLVLV
ncbi:uncharacterized protein LOC130150621 [Falco biarmicus]|uniref:uncharacterized protein LOC130150621 n=1 Tax=Falco biarmicus TaxID=345155 RepID=UPI0024BBF77F|nr:uncharacterized protein LOC130150621 [Falco biarmicus]